MATPDDSVSRRQALYARRDELRARQAEHMARQRHDAQVESFHRDHGADLLAAGARFELVWDDDTYRGPLVTYPIGFASIRWDLVPHAVSRYGGTDEALKELFDEALLALAIAPATTVVVDWCRGGFPRVALSAGDASAHAIALMRCSSDMWVYAPGASWVIEVHHDGHLTHADRPGLPEHAGDGWRPRQRVRRDGA